MCQSLCGPGSGTPKLVKRDGSLALSRPGRIDIVRPYFAGQRPRACCLMTTCFLEAVHGCSTGSWKSWALRLGGTAVGILCAGVAAVCVTLTDPRCSSSSGGDVGAVSGPLCGMQQRLRTRLSWALFDCLQRQGRGGATGVLTHPEVWAPNMFPAEAAPLPTAAFHPPAWPEELLDPPPPPAVPKAAGGGDCREELKPTDPPRQPPPLVFPPRPPPDPGEWVEPLLRSTPVTAPGLRMGGGSAGSALRSRGPHLPSAPASEPLHPAPSPRDAGVRGVTWGDGRTRARFSKHGGGPLEWWAVPCVYRRAWLARRWRWVLQRRGEGLMPVGVVWLGPLEWPEPVPRLERQRSVGVLARRSRRRRACWPPAWLTLRGWLSG